MMNTQLIETTGEAMARIYPSIECDAALPQDFHNSMPTQLFGCIVWAYTPASNFGLPAPLTQSASNWLEAQGALDRSVTDSQASSLIEV